MRSRLASFTTLLLLTIGLMLGIGGSRIVTAVAAQTPSDGARRITPDELREALKKQQAILIDVRSPESYRAGHVKGALNIPAGEIANHVDELPKDKLIATYCS